MQALWCHVYKVRHPNECVPLCWCLLALWTCLSWRQRVPPLPTGITGMVIATGSELLYNLMLFDQTWIWHILIQKILWGHSRLEARCCGILLSLEEEWLILECHYISLSAALHSPTITSTVVIEPFSPLSTRKWCFCFILSTYKYRYR